MARQLAADGTSLVLVARNEERLDALASEFDVECEVLAADLGDPTELSYVEERLRGTNLPIDLLVNNAGFGTTGAITDLDLEHEAAVVDVNVVAVHRLAIIAAQRMAKVGAGGILNVSSMAGFMASPTGATYAATKSFVTTFSESLHSDLLGSGVHVSVLCPGFTRTEFQDRASYDTSRLPEAVWQSADEVAREGLAGVDRNAALVVPGAQNKVGAAMINLMPRRAVRFAMRRLPA